MQDQISTSSSPEPWTHRAVVASILLLINIISNITNKGNYKPDFLAFLLQIINVLLIIISEQ